MEEEPKEEVELKEKVEEKEIPEDRISEEIILEEKILEEKIPERISEERKEERIERIVVEKKDEAVQTDDDIGESSSDSDYCYSMYIIYLCFALYFYYKRVSLNACNLFHESVKVIIDMPAYQEGSREIESKHRRMPFKDIEAQKIREDVTIQVSHCTTLIFKKS